MKKYLAKFGLWLFNRFNGNGYLLSIDQNIIAEAKHITELCETDVPGASGENKRHRAYAKLLRLFPDASRKDVSMAIEIALRF